MTDARSTPPSPSSIKVFRLNDWEWWAADTLEAAIAHWKQRSGLTDEELEEPRELTADEMAKLEYVEHEDDPPTRRSFAAELAQRVAAGLEFPQPFATTEY